MVSVIIKSGQEAKESQRHGEFRSPCRASPLLELPSDLPQTIEFDGVYGRYEPTYHTETVVDEHLTSILHECPGFENLQVEILSLDCGSNVPIINAYNNSSNRAIGGRLDMLHNQFGIGPLVLHLLDMSPLYIMTPSEVESTYLYYEARSEEEVNHIHDNEQRSGLYPTWINDVSKRIPHQVPPKLKRILKKCRKVMDSSLGLDLPESVGRWPIATCSWYGFEPYQSRSTNHFIRDQDYLYETRKEALNDWIKVAVTDQGQKSDPLWIALDALMREQMEYMHASCMPVFHNQAETEEQLRNFKPFAELLNYISHATIDPS